MKKRLVLRNKKRFTVFLVFFVSIIITSVFTIYSYSYNTPEYKTVVVKTGDTLWDIAKTHSPNTDVRKYIYNVRKINKLEDNTIYTGTILKIPVNNG